MQQPYWVGEFYIDPSRNEIKRSTEVVSVQPKVMAVLNLLATNQGQVVGHEDIMQSVWPDVFVTPNTLQRCIAELRKAFADDSRQQLAIKTHPKVGYSLELLVNNNKPAKTRGNLAAYSGLIIVSILLLIVSDAFFELEPVGSQFKLLPLTASDQREYYPGYSPDGNLLIFHRYEGTCKNHLWAKDLKNGTEYRLTSGAGIYQEQSWLPEQDNIFYSVQENCGYDSLQSPCWTIHGLNVMQALSGPQRGKPLFNCVAERISSPVQIDKSRILFLRGEDHNTLYSFSLNTSAQRVFYQLENTHIESFAYAPQTERIALIVNSNLGYKSIILLDESGQLVDENMIKMPSDITIRQTLSVKFDSTGTSLLFSASKGLYVMELTGHVSYIDLPIHENIHKPAFHPDGSKLVFMVGNNDADVTVVNTTEDKPAYQTLARSTAYDADGLFRPNSESIVFSSSRSGTRQLWLFEQGKVRQLSHFQYDTRFSGFGWSPNGNRIAIASNDQLYLIDDSIHEHLPTPGGVLQFHHWISDSRQLLTIQTEQGPQLVQFNLQSNQIEPLYSAMPVWAKQIDTHTTLYLDSNKYLYRLTRGRVAPELISTVPLHSKRYVWNDDALWGIDEESQNVWRYRLDEPQVENVLKLRGDTWWLSDVKQESLLITTLVSTTNQIFEAAPP